MNYVARVLQTANYELRITNYESPSLHFHQFHTQFTKARKQAGSMRQLGAKKRQKSVEVFAKNELWDVETLENGGANCG